MSALYRLTIACAASVMTIGCQTEARPVAAGNLPVNCRAQHTTDDAKLVYDMDELSAGQCAYDNFLLSFSNDFTHVSFICFENGVTTRLCDLAATPGQEYEFTLGEMDGNEAVVDIRSVPVVTPECQNHDISVVFRDTTDVDTLCLYDMDLARGFGELRLPNKSARIVLTPS